jgi:DNA-binding response OmpR family regulator
MDGYEMTRRLKADPRTAGVPVLMLTTRDQPLAIIRGLEVGADQFITKPYDDDYLVPRIQALFRQLEEIRAGRLPEQQALERFGQEIVIFKTRAQILQMLLQATARAVEDMAAEHKTNILIGDGSYSRRQGVNMQREADNER